MLNIYIIQLERDYKLNKDTNLSQCFICEKTPSLSSYGLTVTVNDTKNVPVEDSHPDLFNRAVKRHHRPGNEH